MWWYPAHNREVKPETPVLSEKKPAEGDETVRSPSDKPNISGRSTGFILAYSWGW